MTRKRIVVAASTVVLVATTLALGLARTGQAGGTAKEKGVQWAFITGDGSLQAHSKDVLASAHTSTGGYEITMKKAVTNCALTTSISSDGNGPGVMEVRKDIGISPQSIGVGTYSAAANPMDRDFYLIVACS